MTYTETKEMVKRGEKIMLVSVFSWKLGEICLGHNRRDNGTMTNLKYTIEFFSSNYLLELFLFGI